LNEIDGKCKQTPENRKAHIEEQAGQTKPQASKQTDEDLNSVLGIANSYADVMVDDLMKSKILISVQ